MPRELSDPVVCERDAVGKRGGWCLPVFLLWLSLYLITAAGMTANLQGGWGDDSLADKEYRSDLAFACGWSLLPPAIFVGPFVTGFYEHGFSFKRRSTRRAIKSADRDQQQ